MSLYQIFLITLFISLSWAANSYIHFHGLSEEILINKVRLQSYSNDLEGEGTMDIKVVLDDGQEYKLKPLVCRSGKGQFTWTPPSTITANSHGYFSYTVYYGGNPVFTGQTDSMKFVLTQDKSSDSNTSSDSSNSVNSAENEDNTSQIAPAEANTPISPDNSIINGNNTNIQDNNTMLDNQLPVNNAQQPVQNTNEQKNSQSSNEIGKNDSQGSNGGLDEKYIYYIGGGSGIVVVALTGLLIAYKVKSKKSLTDYEFDSRPYNNTSMDISQMPNLLNGSLNPVNVLGSPNFNSDTSKGSQYGLYNNNNNPKSYRVPNIESTGSGLLLSPSLSTFSPNVNNSNYFTSPKPKDKSKRNTYEMISPYDPRETSYQNFTGNFDDSLELDHNNGIINLNSNPNMNLGVDVNRNLPKSENYSANPRSGSLPRNKVPNEIAVPLMNEEDNEEDKKNYRSSILSYISSNRGSFYGAAQAEHSISHLLLNQVCTVAYASQPENEDELYLCVGDKVRILEVYDDGWAYSLHISSGLEGMIPLNCTAEYYQ